MRISRIILFGAALAACLTTSQQAQAYDNWPPHLLKEDRGKYLPLANVTVGQVQDVVLRRAREYRKTIEAREYERLINQLSRPANCEELGALCQVIPRDSVPKVIAAAWAAAVKGGDDAQMFAALNQAIQQEVLRNTAALEPEIAAIERRMEAAVQARQLDPNNPKAVSAFISANASTNLKVIIGWLPNINLGFGIKCDTRTAGKGLKFRRLVICFGEAWGSTAIVIAGKVVNPGLIGVASFSAHARGAACGGCYPEAADNVRTEFKYDTNTAVSASASTWYVVQAQVYVKSGGAKPCSANGQSNDAGVTINKFTVSKSCG